MAKVKYIGPMQSRELGAADFKKLGVEEGAKKMTFQKDEVVEVDENIAEALMHAEILPGEFEIVEEEDKGDKGEGRGQGDGGQPDSNTETEAKVTKAQQDKIDRAAKAGVAASKKEALSPEAEVAQDGHPQTTDTTGESSGASSAR